ncbi:MAG: Bax inhibitor-1/YccA family protein [Clostridium baratii]|uniref:Inhibitor of apoptosis-promoting Bax1 family protein n=1 Tax=Clostridium baratii str. Sullivan TaxID=1415775 RepID=A0A0A7FXN1_9CLOT|nr:Bax inhibitor-1/YccA family protein [Clostridium baratii]AIY84308.1 inhibitor of apoptosis-promoting Bax1 family protein [Clostridium baratii str. Sullivan]MBS6005572.1 Bax inhibitor-1/YccA family protein [Clostridium baratii]MDU1052638.1 Bax inhibitor-1/YccA family protein [Clostridium baratii]CUP30126.1 Predicted membrane protein [Clostridium baratii]
MNIGKTNPALTSGFKKAMQDGTTMTITGTITKIVILLAVLSCGFIYSWLYIPYSSGIMMGVSILTLIVALITTSVPKLAQYSSIIYAAFEGLFLGCISKLFNMMYPGIVLPAILLTIVCVFVTLIVFGRNPSIADRTRKGVMIALITILATSVIGIILSFFGIVLPIYSNGPIGIIFSLVVVVVATISLMQDYSFILRGTQFGEPKYMEWYAAFGLMVTLVWLYMEILQLIAKIVSSRD